MTKPDTIKLGYLDGLRGIASAWVLLGHAAMLTGLSFPFFLHPLFAVDLFMMISGFLMYYHCALRAADEPMTKPQSWLIFWTRRFFRIAPVYYLALFIFILLGPTLGGFRDDIASLVPDMGGHPERFNDRSLDNIFTHVTFLFGLSPYYHHRTMLPDWSIGLEMQFYAALPFILLIAGRLGLMVTGILLCAAAGLAWVMAPEFMHAFTMPAFLLLKINIFVCGILIAAGLFCAPHQVWRFVLAALIFAIIPLYDWQGIKHAAIPVMLAGSFIALALHHRLPLIPSFIHRLLDMISHHMGRGVLHFMGETSYSVYLLHLFIMTPVAGLLASQFGTDWPALLRFFVCLAVVIPVSYGLGFVLLHIVERPGIALGRSVIQKLKSNHAA